MRKLSLPRTSYIATGAGQAAHRLWYTTDARAPRGMKAILGPEFGHEPGEFTYPVLLSDERGRLLERADGCSKADGCSFRIAITPPARPG